VPSDFTAHAALVHGNVCSELSRRCSCYHLHERRLPSQARLCTASVNGRCARACGCARRTLLVTGGTDARLHVYARGPCDGDHSNKGPAASSSPSDSSVNPPSFQPVLVLSGHEGWVRSIALRHVLPATPATNTAASNTANNAAGGCEASELLISSASQDRWVFLQQQRLVTSRLGSKAAHCQRIPGHVGFPYTAKTGLHPG
jgi:hypothetical protein